jgi:hypothetical protein
MKVGMSSRKIDFMRRSTRVGIISAARAYDLSHTAFISSFRSGSSETISTPETMSLWKRFLNFAFFQEEELEYSIENRQGFKRTLEAPTEIEIRLMASTVL